MKDIIYSVLIAILITIAASYVERPVSLYFFVICLVICFGVGWIVEKISKYISKNRKSKQFKD